MAITLDEAKLYLRVDNAEEDNLILELLKTSEKLVMNVGRMTRKQLEKKSDTTRTAILFCLSYLYETRNTADYHKLTLNLRYILFAEREGVL